MPIFTLYCENPETGLRARFFYDNLTSELLGEDGTPVLPPVGSAPPGDPIHPVSRNAPGIKSTPLTLKIQLGLGCNHACSYCNQRGQAEGARAARGADVERLLAGLPGWFDGGAQGDGTGCRIEFWGGEPLVYRKTLVPLAEALRARYPKALFSLITNGSLLDREINAWLDDLGFHVGVSHDGPGQSSRGPDPLAVPENLDAIRDLYRRLHPKGRFSFNVMLHRSNRSRAAINRFFVNLTGDPTVAIGEGSFIDPYDAGGLSHSFLSDAESLAFRRESFADLRHGRVPNFALVPQRLAGIIDGIARQRPAARLGQKCGMDRSDTLAVDLDGHVLTCQNASSRSIAPNGRPHRIGHVANLDGVRLDTATHWSHRGECVNCPVLQSCRGACMFLDGVLWAAACNNAFADHLPFFAAAIEHLTGTMPFYIDGPQRESRRDIFGLIAEAHQTAHPRAEAVSA